VTRGKIVVLLVAIIGIAAFFFFDLHQYVTLEFAQQQRTVAIDYFIASPAIAILGFVFFYIVITGMSLPGATILTLIAGAIFDFWLGLVIVSFASTFGASLAFVLSRYLFRDLVQNKFSSQLEAVNNGIRKDGIFYLFALRLAPLFPFFVINFVMGLTPIRLITFFWVSQVGMLAGTAVYVNAGKQLGQLETLSGILSPMLIGSFVLLGVFPLVAKKGLDWYRAKYRTSESE